MTREFEIDRRDAIRAQSEAVERRLEEIRQQPEDQQTEEYLTAFREGHQPPPEALAARPSIAKALGRHEDDLM
eukprot:2533835-Amphidinium_carterae.1